MKGMITKYSQDPRSEGYLCLREMKLTFYQNVPLLMSANYSNSMKCIVKFPMAFALRCVNKLRTEIGETTDHSDTWR